MQNQELSLQSRIDDLEKKLTAQNRELEIEAALEKVRARSMAMHKTDELREVVTTVFQQMKNLGYELKLCNILLFDPITEDADYWLSLDEQEVLPESYHVPWFDHPFYQYQLSTWKNAKPFEAFELSGEMKKSWDELLTTQSDVKKIDASVKEMMLKLERIIVSSAAIKNGLLQVISLEHLSRDNISILQRFAKVFEQSYIRFLDLQKAEAQAREAQIETALERVRARTMAMRESPELIQTAELLFDQLNLLGAETQGVAFSICDKKTNIVQKWTSIGVFSVPYTYESGEQRMYEAWRKQEEIYEEVYEGEKVRKYYELFMEIPEFKEGIQKFIGSGHPIPTWQKNHAVVFKYGYLLLITTKPFEETQIFIRFAKVFEQTYTRFLDLQKAEAQAREAQIQLALERVRARTMAMQKSEELREVAIVLYDQLKNLGFENGIASITIMDASTGDMDLWVEGLRDGYRFLESYHVKYFNHKTHIEQLAHWKNGTSYAEIKVSGQEKKAYDKVYFNETDFIRVPEETKALMIRQETVIFSMAYMLYGSLSWSPGKISDEQAKILQRFAKVFEQTYTRFLDLQKAEAQAREAQIEAALEKVRSTSLAMHHPNELEKVVTVLFGKLTELGLSFSGAGIFLFDQEKRNIRHWVTGLNISAPVKNDLPYDEEFEKNQIVKDLWCAKEKGEPIINKSYSKKVKDDFFRYTSKYNDASRIPEDVKKFVFEAHSFTLTCAVETNCLISLDSWLGSFTSDEDFQILKRFARVFEQAYTRFLDLQKAEAQAREAQIETALEKVRSRSLAMHKSEEIKDVVRTVVEKITELNIEMNGGVSLVTFLPESKDLLHWLWIPEQLSETFKAYLPYFDHIIYRDCDEARQNGLELIAKVYSGKEKDEYFNHIFKYSGFKDGPEDVKAWVMQQPYFGFSFAIQKHSGIFLNDYTGKLFSAETNEILKRFSKVFEQSYIRFLDLQKAEAQAREAQIETALERVRSASMAMHSSDDLHKVIRVLTDQLSVLGFHFHTANFITNDSMPDWEIWISSPGVNNVPPRVHVPYIDHILFNERNDAMDAGKEFLTASLNKAEKDIFFHYLFENMGTITIPVERQEWIYQQKGMGLTTVLMKNISLSVINYDGILYTTGENEVIKRFTNVFEQSYTRFLDLQKAEAQAREAQIEAALERVRSRSMAMHKSDDLHEVIKVVTEQLFVLDLKFNVANFAKIEPDGSWDLWLSTPEQTYPALIHVPYLNHPVFNDITEQVAKNNDFYTHVYSFEESNIFFHHFFENTIAKNSPEERKQFVYGSKGFTRSLFLTKNIWFSVSRYDNIPFTDEENAIFKRFANVFEQAYTRFLDLQKAEAQARESQIQLALERVRARAMAMHRSDELSDVLSVLFEQYDVLEIDPVYVDLSIFDLPSNTFTWRCTGKAGLRVIAEQVIDLDSMEIWKDAVEKWRSGETHQVVELFFPKEVLPRVFELFSDIRSKIPKEAIFTEQDFPAGLYTTQGFCRFGALGFGHNRKATEEEKTIAAKIATEFERLYQRFLDLQRAEVQAREAQVEAALERVRAKVMAMRSPEDLNETIKVFFHQLGSLNLTPGRCGVGLLNKENRSAELSTMNTTTDGQSFELTGKLDMTIHPVLEGVYNGWLKQKEYQPVLRGNEIKEYYKIVRPQTDFPDYPDDAVQYGYFFFFDEGGVYAWTEKQIEEAELQIYRRFTSVLNLTYKRYQDLKQAEANAKEAVKQAALDRIRADIASMRSVSDLDRITPLIWNELTILDIPFMRCGVFIMDDAKQLIHTFLSAPDGRAIAAFHMPYDTPGNLGKVLSHWQEKKNYTDHWSENEFMSLADVLVKQGSIANREEYLTSLPQGGFYLHFLPFLQGMLYVGNTTQLSEEEIKLLQSVADAFSTAYARYEDFKKLEAAKQQVDKTLVDLKQAQTQLVQSEKMASLGELTAGIAHEIQNPLNFVNNFSEVNKEMIDELQTELKAGHIEEAVAISNDIRDNEEKINHHGKRADSIVKGMLQHSRSSAGIKEPTDINKLADEYLRLAYHGLRAKDKIFNTEIKTDFDNNIGKINIVPQDIGRVLLNLFNNAFYAVGQKLKVESSALNAEGSQYVPSVTVVTKKLNDRVEISVADNGNGIPQNIVDKIFQPFFTTKPTGQGTGLGLSLAYDIIKAHDGEIKVETKEGEGSAFVIQLPTTA